MGWRGAGIGAPRLGRCADATGTSALRFAAPASRDSFGDRPIARSLAELLRRGCPCRSADGACYRPR
jgi:hypothetical protein